METKDLSDEILDAVEKDKVRTFAEDKVAFEAVKKYILAVAVKHGVFEKGKPFNGNMNYALNLAWGATQGQSRSDEELGQNLRALTTAVQLVESGFQEILDLTKKVEPVKENKKNPAE